MEATMSNLPPQPGPEEYGRGGPPAGSADSGVLSPTWMITEPAPPGWQPKSKVAAGVLGILLGGIGIHSFYLGNAKKGVIQIVVSIVTCGIGTLWGLVEGIMILVGNITTDAYGVPLTE
jgi:TM2 domain-containing membrane protein YozV